MKILVDADACPTPVKEIICRAAQRSKTETFFIANQHIKVPPSQYIQSLRVSSGFDEADHEIVRRTESGDLIVTSDLPLASDVIDKGGLVINSRGEPLTPENIKSRLNMRDFMETMRASGMQSGGPPPYSQTDRQNFANQLDRILARAKAAQARKAAQAAKQKTAN
ncbi:MAG: YaiI/YqxD family protein [Pontibacterium sp.]